MPGLNILVKKPILFEDATMFYNKWVSGIAAREFGTKRVKFKDMFSRTPDYTDQSPNTAKAEPVMPYPLPNAVAALGELAINLSNAISMFRATLKNPTVQKDKKAKAEIITILNELKAAQEHFNSLFITLQKRAINLNDEERESVDTE